MIAEVTLDYTDHAPPFTVVDVRRDLDAFLCSHLGEPDKIVLWVHQWDYLANAYRPRKQKFALERDALDRVIAAPTKQQPCEANKLWGIPVEVLGP